MKILLYIVTFLSVLFSESYPDRLRVYIDNSIKSFQIHESGNLSNIDELNNLLIAYKAEKIEKWLPNALPTDRDGEIYLNRYYIVYFELNQDKYLLNNKNFMIKSYVTQVGTGSQNPQSDKGAINEMPNKAKITLNMSEFKDRNGFSSEDLRGEIQQRVNKKFPGLLISVEKDAKGPPVGYPINIEVSGRNYGKIIEVASSMRTFLDSKKISILTAPSILLTTIKAR